LQAARSIPAAEPFVARFLPSTGLIWIKVGRRARRYINLGIRLQGSQRGQTMAQQESHSNTDDIFILFFRLTMGWTFLWAAIHHFGDDNFVMSFLSHVKTFHDVYASLTSPTVVPALTFLVEYGHLLIGLSLISGLFVRISAPFAIMLMLLYWTAHMDFPYIENVNNYLIDYHIVYAGILVYLIVKRAGHVFGLDGVLERVHLVEQYPVLRPLVG
jgi:thiosulfate dehydrogenase (quinone) large subunit